MVVHLVKTFFIKVVKGMSKNSRKGCAGAYRHGFNGKELDGDLQKHLHVGVFQ